MTHLRASQGTRRPGHWLAAAVGLLAMLAGRVAVAAEPPEAQSVRQAIAELDDEKFAVRDQAAERLEQWVEKEELGTFLAAEFAKVLASTDSSFEVRTRLELLAKQLPAAPANITAPAAAEIIPQMDLLDSDSSVSRDSARRRLQAMLNRVELVCPLLLETKFRLANPKLSAQARRVLEPLLEQVREAWVMADPERMILPAVSAEQMNEWLDIYLLPSEGNVAVEPARDVDLPRQPVAEHHPPRGAEHVERELTDLLVRDDTRGELLKLVEKRLAGVEDPTVVAKLKSLADFARPSMAAEVWRHHSQEFLQYLTIGVPQHNEGANRPTLFDRIDDVKAHCVSGNSLNEGDYPVGLAIPHPDPNRDAMYHLINLPTPRRRLAFEYWSRRDESQRLAELSERTVSAFLKQKQVLVETEVLMLAQLDPHVVSRFVGPYFTAVDNQPLFTTTAELAGQMTVHGGVCYILTRVGTREAIPALEQTARSGRLGKPNYDSPYAMAWVAALAIARHDPWPEVDAWLAGLIELETPLITNSHQLPDVGATAAAMLLERREVPVQTFGLATTSDQGLVERLQVTPYRFTEPKFRDDVRQWWAKNKSNVPTSPAP